MTAQEIITAWNAMTTEQQLNYCKACVCAALKEGYHISAGYEMDDAVDDTYIKVLEQLRNPNALDADSDRRTAEGKVANTLGAIISRAAKAGLERTAYQIRKHSVAQSHQITIGDGQVLDVLYTIAADTDTERAALMRVVLQDFTTDRDDTDREIIKGRINGLTEREIAAIVGMSGPAVNKRIAKMRAALREIIA